MIKQMTNKGQVTIFLLMFATVIIILALALSPSIRDVTSIARNATINDTIGLDCDNASISDFDRSSCVIVDMYNPYFVGILIGLAGLVIGARVIFGG